MARHAAKSSPSWDDRANESDDWGYPAVDNARHGAHAGSHAAPSSQSAHDSGYGAHAATSSYQADDFGRGAHAAAPSRTTYDSEYGTHAAAANPYHADTSGYDAYGSASQAYSAPASGYGAHDSASQPYSPDASSYSAENYSRASRGGRRGNGKRAGNVVKMVLGVLVALIAILIIAVFAYATVFDQHTHANLSSSTDELANVLTSASDQDTEPYYVLLLGSDWRENSGTSDKEEMSGDNQRADVIILARLDPTNKQVTLVSVPRDTRWEYNGTTYKINEAYNIGGAALEAQAVSELVGVSISHTVEMHFSGLEELVDALGGVEVDVPKTIEYKDALTGEKVAVEEGTQLLNGQEAQIFARVRKSYDTDNQDQTRQGNVRTLVLAIVDTMRDKSPLEWPGLGLKVADCLGTDMSFFDFVSIAAHFMSGKMTLYSGTGPADGEIDDAAGGLWLCYKNTAGWKAVMDVVDAGGDPSDIDADTYPTDAESTTAVPAGAYDEYGNYLGENAGYYDEYGNYVGTVETDAGSTAAGYYDEYGNYVGESTGYYDEYGNYIE